MASYISSNRRIAYRFWIRKCFKTFCVQLFSQILISDRFTHRPNKPWTWAPRNSFLWRFIINLKFAQLRSGIASQFSLKRAKMSTYQYSNNTIILFATQYENDNITFHWSSAVSGGLALLWAFCQWKIEHQVRKCQLCERLTEEHGWTRERCRPSMWKWLQAVA